MRLRKQSFLFFLLAGLVIARCASAPSRAQPLDGEPERRGVWVVQPVLQSLADASDEAPTRGVEMESTANSLPESADPSAASEPSPRKTPSLGEVISVLRGGGLPKGTAALYTLQVVPENPSAGCFADGCHASLITQVGGELHQPFAEGRCDPCHSIDRDHPEGVGWHVSTAADIQVCEACHPLEDLGVTHPVGSDIVDPVTGGVLTCTSTCHDPHAAPFPGLLRFSGKGELCVKCHEDL